ncbi:MAG: flagellar hook assembly protein FlgD [Clostridium sp.]
MSNFTVNGYAGPNKTDRGTPIMKPGQDMDKNAFLKILSAELANQDPTADIDPTAYVSQMAQFAAMEQMQNLNQTMTSSTAHNLVGKGVTVSVTDSEGKPYTGVVKGVSSDSRGTTLSVEVNEGGKTVYKDFRMEDVLTVLDVPDYSVPPLNNMNGNIQFLVASSFIGKDVELSAKDEEGNNLKGSVKGVYKDNGQIKIRVELEGGEIKEYNYEDVVKVGDFSGTIDGEEGSEGEKPEVETPDGDVQE